MKVIDTMQPKGLVERRLFSGEKLFRQLKQYGIEFEFEFDHYSFRELCTIGAKELGTNLFSLVLENSAKSQFADNVIWRFLKRNFNLDLQIPLITGFWTKNAITRKNLVVDTGLKRYADQIGGTATSPMTALAIGTSSTAPAAADTALGSEITTQGGARHAATITNITTSTTGDTEQWQYTWTFTGSFAITEEGIFDNNSSGGTMLAHNTFSQVNVVSGDSFQITHKIQS